MMQMLFIDESGTPPPNNRAGDVKYFVLGGLIISENTWPKVAKDLKALKSRFDIKGEIKWRYFAPSKSGKINPLSHLTAEKKEAVRTAMYNIIASYKSNKIISVIIDAEASYKLSYINTAEDIYLRAYKIITERFQYYLQDQAREVGKEVYGIVVCDNRMPKEDENLRNLHEKLITGESKYQNIKFFSRYLNIIEGLFIAPSHLSVGIQFADMAAGAVFRKFKANDDRFFNQIQQSIRRSNDGKLDGYGLCHFP